MDLQEKRRKNREYQKAFYERKKNGEGPRDPGRPKNTSEVLWSKVDKKGEDECWPWLGVKNKNGYGRTTINEYQYYAHRVIFNLVNPGMITLQAPKSSDETGFIMHTCDNPSCCNPKHLKVCTHAENMADKAKKGRCPDYKGGKGPRCKLTMVQAKEARELKKNGMSTRDLAKQFGISLPSMKTLLAGKSYKENNA